VDHINNDQYIHRMRCPLVLVVSAPKKEEDALMMGSLKKIAAIRKTTWESLGENRRNVAVMGLMSLFNDIASEMIYPLLPIFLTSVLGAGPAVLGLIEGVAESTASLLKFFSGYISDRWKQRKPLVVLGYAVSNLVRPLIGVAAGWPLVLALRFADRVGKGIRTAPRDSLLSSSTSHEKMGLAFGLQRAMDNAGAVLGPLAAVVLLSTAAFSYRSVFLLSIIPGVAVIFLAAAALNELPMTAISHREQRPAGLRSALKIDPSFRRYLWALFIFYLGNSTDAFLLLRASSLGISVMHIPLLWMVFHMVKSIICLPGGWASDMLGKQRLIFLGWIVYAAVYLGFAAASSPGHIWLLFVIYGVYFGLTEGAERALVAQMAESGFRGTAFGLFNLTVGIAALPASVLFGVIWNYLGAGTAFCTGSALAIAGAMILPRGGRQSK
jgi:MFS family permease